MMTEYQKITEYDAESDLAHAAAMIQQATEMLAAMASDSDAYNNEITVRLGIALEAARQSTLERDIERRRTIR